MCSGCGDEYFKDKPRPPLTPAMMALAEEIAQSDQDYQLTYGALHIVIDDWNLQAHHIEWCLSYPDHKPPITEQERSIGRRLLGHTEAERYALMEQAEARSIELHHAGKR